MITNNDKIHTVALEVQIPNYRLKSDNSHSEHAVLLPIKLGH
jgi:hypothetical protein